MSNAKLILLVIAAAVLGGAAYLTTGGARRSAPRLNGARIFPELDVTEVASLAYGDLKAECGTNGWEVTSYHGYPADRAKLTNVLLALTELKVGQVVRGKALEKPDELVLRNAQGAELARLALGEKHAKWGHGRYAKFTDETVLVSDTLDALDGNGKALVETKIVDTPRIAFNDIVEGLSESELGFATGVVATVTIGAETNRTVTVGNAVKGGSDRYLKLDRSAWIFTVPAYSVESLLPKKEESKDNSKK